MYDLPESYINAATAAARKIALRVDLGEVRDGSYVDKASYTGGKGVLSLKIVRGQTTGGFSLGGTVCATLTATFSNDVEINVKDRIQVYVGFGAPESVPKWQGLGWFYVDSVKKGMDNQSVTACDAMLRFAKNYKSKLTYPAKVSNILEEISGQTKINLSSGLSLFNDVQIEKTPEKGEDKDGNKQYYTRREVLGYLAGINGGSAYIDIDFKINLAVPKETGYTISWKNTTSQSVDDTDFSVSHIVWNRSGITHSLGDDFEENTVEFTDPLAYTSSELILHNLETNIIGLSYNSITIKKQGTGMFQLGDLVDYEALDGKTYKMLIMGIVYDFSGGFFSETLYSLAKSASQQEYAGNQVIDQTEHIKETAGTSSNTADAITTYEYVSDPSVKINEVEYTIEKNDSGLISKITDSLGNSLKPVVRGEITDIALHNAALWGAVMARGIGQPQLEMPYMQGINYYYIPETRAISDSAWKNYRKGETNNKGDISLPNGAIEDNHALNLKFEHYGQVDTVSSVKVFYCLARVHSSESDLAFPFLFTRAGKDESLGYFIGEGVTKTSGSGQITGHYHRLGVGTNNGCYYARYVSTANDGKITYQSINTTSPKGTFDTSVLKRYFPTEESFNEYHVYAVVAELNGNSDTPFDLYWYIDGERFGNTPSITDKGTQYYLNSISSSGVYFGGLDVSYLAYAMGTGDAYHTPEMVKANSEWLLKKAKGDWKS